MNTKTKFKKFIYALAPMAGVTDLPFRIICKKYGNPGLVCNEMVSSKAIHYGSEKTKKMLNYNGLTKTKGVQIFGNDPVIMGKVIKENNFSIFKSSRKIW